MTKHIIQPKADFLADPKRAGLHQDLVLSPEFREAAKIALLQYAINIGGDDADINKLAQVGLKLEGARGVLSVLLNLGEVSASKFNIDPNELTPV